MKTAKEFAELLNGRQYRNEVTGIEAAEARESGLLLVFGASDDLMEFDGAIHDEFDCWEGQSFSFDIEHADGRYSIRRNDQGNGLLNIRSIWGSENPEHKDASWAYECNVPHETFTIMEDDDVYCIGMVIDLKQLIASK